jgi:hypothetical protein
MRKRFSANKYLAFTLALAGFAAAGMAPAFAQSASKYGSVIPYHYLADGTQAPGWNPAAPSVRQLAQAPSTNNNGYGAFAQVPATILNSAAPAGINYYSPATSGYDPGIETQR